MIETWMQFQHDNAKQCIVHNARWLKAKQHDSLFVRKPREWYMKVDPKTPKQDSD